MILGVMGCALLIFAPIAGYYHEAVAPFVVSGTLVFAAGTLLFFFSGREIGKITEKKDIFVVVTVTWLVFILAGTLPYVFSHTFHSFIDVIFETTSGFTTTGSSVLKEVGELPKSIALWRSFTQWLGGIGTLVTVVSVFPLLNIGGYGSFALKKPETQQLFHDFKSLFFPILAIYSSLTIVQILLMHWGGMPLFESVCYAFGLVSSGCFSPAGLNVADYSSYIQYLMIAFMWLSALSTLFYFGVLTRPWGKTRQNEEVKIYGLTLLIVLLVVSGALFFKSAGGIEPVLRNGLFQVTSFMTSTGYATSNYLQWPAYSLFLLLFLLFVGGSSASTSGGIRIPRLVILMKNLKLVFHRLNAESDEDQVRYNAEPIDETTNLSILTFVTLFGFILIAGTIFLAALGIDFEQSAFLAITSLTNFGHSLNMVDLPTTGKVILSLLMVMGRLEIVPVLMLLSPFASRTGESGIN